MSLRDLDIQVITVPTLRLDLADDRVSLKQTVAQLRPRLLILDPFVRLHRIDENASGEVAPLLAYLRELQREYDVAIVVVHHAKKGAGNVRAGQALRGSSELHAWGDSNLYLRRDGDTLALAVEHRAAPALKPMKIELVETGEALALKLVERNDSEVPVPSSLDERITAALATAPPRSPSPSSARTVGSAPPPSMSVSLPSVLPAASSKLATAAIAWLGDRQKLPASASRMLYSAWEGKWEVMAACTPLPPPHLACPDATKSCLLLHIL